MQIQNGKIVKQIEELVQSGIIQKEYSKWLNSLENANNQYTARKDAIEIILNKEFSALDDANRDLVIAFLDLVWSNDAFGSIGQGKPARADVVRNRVSEFYLFTKELLHGIHSQKLSLGALFNKISVKIDGRGELKAAKLRAISILMDLKVPSLYDEKTFWALVRLLQFDSAIVFPDSGPLILQTLANLLHQNHRENKFVLYIFPWVIYDQFINNEYGQQPPKISADDTINKNVTTPKEQDHFYTTSSKRENLGGYKEIGTECYILKDPVKDSVELHRYYFKSMQDHFYCINPNNEVIQSAKKETSPGWVYRNVSESNGLVPLYRFFNRKLFDHYYTIYPDWDKLIANGYEKEGIECYVYDKYIEGTVPLELWVLGNSMHKIDQETDSRRILQDNTDFENSKLKNEPIIKPGLAGFNREGNHKEQRDHLDFMSDVDALANLIAYKKVNPPIAIGLFGNWGAGKSFFMSKLEDRITQLADSDYTVYCKNILHVKFNSWHYSDSNLWASLVAEIFDSLNEFATSQKKSAKEILYEKLNSGKKLLEEANGKLKSVNDKKENFEKKLVKIIEKKEQESNELKKIKSGDILKEIFEDVNIKGDINSIKEKFNCGSIETVQQINDQIGALEMAGGKFVKAIGIVQWFRVNNLTWILFVPIFVILVGFVLNHWFENLIQNLIERLIASLLAVSSILGGLLKVLQPAIKKINQGYNRLKSLKERVEQMQRDKMRQRTDQEININNALQDLSMEEHVLKQQVNDTELLIKETEKEITDIKEGRRLAKFIEDRSSSSDYKNHLGIISWIRKDFEELDKLLREHSEFKDSRSEFQVDRIILYIDDLDRCPKERVIEVLKAIHLLLAFPLFAVVVGVDTRWVSDSLIKGYEQLTSDTSYDYLEKIFQIPFSLKPVTEESAKRLIKSLSEKNVTFPKTKLPDSSDKVENVQTTKAPESSVLEKINIQDIQYLPAIDPEALELSQEEIQFIQEISPLIGVTPRTINRYMNIYQIIRSHADVQYSENRFTDLKAIMLLLGIIISQPEDASRILKLMKTTECKDIGTFFNSDKNIMSSLKNIFERSEFVEVKKLPIANFKNNQGLVSRFSFRTLV